MCHVLEEHFKLIPSAYFHWQTTKRPVFTFWKPWTVVSMHLTLQPASCAEVSKEPGFPPLALIFHSLHDFIGHLSCGGLHKNAPQRRLYEKIHSYSHIQNPITSISHNNGELFPSRLFHFHLDSVTLTTPTWQPGGARTLVWPLCHSRRRDDPEVKWLWLDTDRSELEKPSGWEVKHFQE